MKELKLITGRQLARALKCDITTIWRWKKEKKIKPIGRLGGCDVYRIEDIEELGKKIEKSGDGRLKKINNNALIRIGRIIDFGGGLVVSLKREYK